MTVIVTTCRQYRAEFEPTHDAIIAGVWRLCPACRPESTAEHRCTECGRPLRAGKRSVCARCLGVTV